MDKPDRPTPLDYEPKRLAPSPNRLGKRTFLLAMLALGCFFLAAVLGDRWDPSYPYDEVTAWASVVSCGLSCIVNLSAVLWTRGRDPWAWGGLAIAVFNLLALPALGRARMA
jgi:hypothetical protein